MVTAPRRAALVAALLAVAPAARAETARSEFAPSVVAAIPTTPADVGQVRLVGRSGQLYSRTAENHWERDNVGGVAVDVLGAIERGGKKLLAIGSYSPIFEYDGSVWSARPLPNRGRVRMSRGSRAVAFSVGRHVYVLKSGKPERLLSASKSITAMWASSATKIYVATSKGKLARSSGSSWVTLTHPLADGDPIVEMYGAPKKELYARSKSGVILHISGSKAKKVEITGDLEGLDIHTSGVGPKGELLLAGTVGKDETRKAVLIEGKASGLEIADTLWTLTEGDRFTVVAGDKKGQLLVASRRGSLRIRGKDGSWVEGSVSGMVPAGSIKTFDESTPARAR